MLLGTYLIKWLNMIIWQILCWHADDANKLASYEQVLTIGDVISWDRSMIVFALRWLDVVRCQPRKDISNRILISSGTIVISYLWTRFEELVTLEFKRPAGQCVTGT